MRNPREEAARHWEAFEAANRGANEEERRDAWVRHITNVFRGLMDDPVDEEVQSSYSDLDSNATSISIPSSLSISRAVSGSTSRSMSRGVSGSISRSGSLDNLLELLERRRSGRFSYISIPPERLRTLENIPLFAKRKNAGKRIADTKPLERFRNICKDEATGEPSAIFCAICGDANSISLMTAPVPCTHRCCVECYRDYASRQIQRIHSVLIKCPQTYCTLTHPPNYWTKYIPSKVAERKEFALLCCRAIEIIGTGRKHAFLHYVSWC